MKITFLTEGVLPEEQAAFSAIQRAFPEGWRGFAGFQLMQRAAQPLDIDLVMLTGNRILVVELKNWQGNITFADQSWIQGRRAARSPVHLTNYKCKILLDLLKQKMPGTTQPKIDPLVVLCHPTSNPILPEAEMQHVMLLEPFCSLGRDRASYLKRFPQIPGDRSQPSADPLQNAAKYDLFFAPGANHIGKRRFAIQGFEQLRLEADYVHPRAVYSEFEAQDQESKRSKALLRRWNFNNLASGNTTNSERSNIALRETRVNESIRVRSPELHKDLLEPVGRPTADDVTTFFTEAYRLGERFERLSDHLRKLPLPESSDAREGLVKVLLARFSELHRIEIAHRDIHANSLWVQPPLRLVLSSFATSYLPEQETVGVHRVELEQGAIGLPEGNLASPGATPFRRDVFQLAAMVFELLAGRPVDEIDAIPVFGELPSQYAALQPWFSKALSWTPSERFKDATEALNEWNLLTATANPEIVSRDDLLIFSTVASPSLFLPVETIQTTDGKWVYRSTSPGGPVAVKLWTGLAYDEKRGTRNRRILSFLETARRLQQSNSTDHPVIVDFGLGPLGLVLVTKWIDGKTLAQWMTSSPEAAHRAALTSELISSVLRLHGLGVTHGDIKPTNIVVRENESGRPQITMIDIPDLQADGDEGFTPAYVPAHLLDASPAQRDLYASARIASELLAECSAEFPLAYAECLSVLELAEEGCPIGLIADAIEKELLKAPEEPVPEFAISHRGNELSDDWLVGDNDRFPINVIPGPKPGETYYFVLGVTHQVRITVETSSGRVTGTWVKPVSHSDYIRNVAKSALSLRCRIKVKFGATEDAHDLIEHLRRISGQGRIRTDEEGLDDESDADSELDDDLPSADVVSARRLWGALATLEAESLTRITVREGARVDPTDSSRILVPYDLDSGTVEYAIDEEVEVLGKRYDPATGLMRWAKVAYLSVEHTTDSQLAIRVPKRRRLDLEVGAVYGIKGRQDRIAADRRRLAMRRILDDRSVIRRMPEYFDATSLQVPATFPVPEEIDIAAYGLNPEQTDAFKHILSTGPIGLLQGPPGTGKTKFIASLVHYILSSRRAGNVLLVSQSHEAINHALKKVKELTAETGLRLSIVRVGRTGSTDSAVALGDLHESAHQQRYRERFAAEIKVRVEAAAKAFLLPDDYVSEATDFHLGLGILLKQLGQLQAEGIAHSQEVAPDKLQRFTSLIAAFRRIAKDAYGVSTSGSDFEGAGARIRQQMAIRHNNPSPSKCAQLEDLIEMSLEFTKVLRNPSANFTAFLARASEVVAGTCVGIGRQGFGIVDHVYDWVIIDEAARSSATELAVAMQVGRRILLVGDHKQLPPAAQSPGFASQLAEQLGVASNRVGNVSAFKRAFSSNYGLRVGHTLRRQYRMASTIGTLVSDCFYKDTPLINERGVPSEAYALLPGHFSKEVTWIDTSDRGRSGHEDTVRRTGKKNDAEIKIILGLLRDIAECPGFLAFAAGLDGEEFPIGVITMYASQRDILRQKFDEADWASPIRSLVSIGTVDSYQGKENRIIILSLVRNNPTGEVGFLFRPERINVAISRAMDRLFIVGATSMWRYSSSLPLHDVLMRADILATGGMAAIIPSKEMEVGAREEAN